MARTEAAPPIDIVIAWVDGNDPAWQAEKARFAPGAETFSGAERYRDWGSLRYLFRGIERFAPWARSVFLVTWGHVPPWLNTAHPQLRVVRHEDYIPAEYLPTFNANPIELNFHRIEGLAERFVYFNDDMLLTKKTRATDFFLHGKPRDTAVLTAHTHDEGDLYGFFMYRAAGLINKHFRLRDVIARNRMGWYNPRYGRKALRTFLLRRLFKDRFPGILHHHLPSSLTKTAMAEVWALEREKLEETCRRKFRSLTDFNQYVFTDWQVASGAFAPRRAAVGKVFNLTGAAAFDKAIAYIRDGRGYMISINDHRMSEEDYRVYSQGVCGALDVILPGRCAFELDE